MSAEEYTEEREEYEAAMGEWHERHHRKWLVCCTVCNVEVENTQAALRGAGWLLTKLNVLCPVHAQHNEERFKHGWKAFMTDLEASRTYQPIEIDNSPWPPPVKVREIESCPF